MLPSFSIGEAAKGSGVKVPTIRFYEQIGLLPAPSRSEMNRRSYREADVRRLLFIRHARELGFDIAAIRTLLTLQEDQNQSCDSACAIAVARLREVEQRLRSLKALKTELASMLAGCQHGKIAQCRVIEVVADHGECNYADHRTGRPKRAAARVS